MPIPLIAPAAIGGAAYLAGRIEQATKDETNSKINGIPVPSPLTIGVWGITVMGLYFIAKKVKLL